MFVQTQETPNPNSLKFIPGTKVSTIGSAEFLNINQTDNILLRNILSISGVEGIFVGEDFISVNKVKNIKWEDIKHIVIAHINEYYDNGNDYVLDKKNEKNDNQNYQEIERQIINLLETKIKPAVSRDGGDIKFIEFKNGVVKVQLRGSCSGCPSSVITLKQGVQNLLTHYIPDVKQVIAIS